MIVVIGAVVARPDEMGPEPVGLVSRIALTAARSGAMVEVVTRLGDDPTGDALLLAFARAGIGHVATLRDAARPTPVVSASAEPAVADPEPGEAPKEYKAPASLPALDARDVGLALRYLPEIGLVVLVHPAGPDVVAEAVGGATYAEAHLVVIVRPGEDPPSDLAGEPLVLEAADDAEGVGELVGRYAVAVDGGHDPEAAFGATIGAIA